MKIGNSLRKLLTITIIMAIYIGVIAVQTLALEGAPGTQEPGAQVTVTRSSAVYPLQIIFARGLDNALWYRIIDGMIIRDWVSLGGYITSDPDAVLTSPNRIDVFVRGADNALWQRTGEISDSQFGWYGWKSLGGILTSGPGAETLHQDNKINVFVRGTDNAIWGKGYDGSSWGGWYRLGGIVTSDPEALGPLSNQIVVRGTDNAIWFYDNYVWNSLGGISSSGPAISYKYTSLGPAIIIFTAGENNAIWYDEFDIANQKFNWVYLGGNTPSSPDATYYGKFVDAEYIDLVVRGTDNALWMKSWSDTTGWSNWYNLGGIISSGPSIVTIHA